MGIANTPMNCWIVTDGVAGNEKQCLALAHYLRQQLELDCRIIRVHLSQPWRALSPHLTLGSGWAPDATSRQQLREGSPDLVISCGRKGALVSRWLKQRHSSRCRSIQILDPRVSTRHFDLVICPRHDDLEGDNVIQTIGSLHRIDEQSLALARETWQSQLADRAQPRIAVLVGASNRVYHIDRAYLMQMKRCVDSLLDQAGRKQCDQNAQPGSIMVTASRRSDPQLLEDINQVFADDHVQMASNFTENPYEGFLAWADAIVVSADSVNMISEALGTGKPVFCSPPVADNNKFDQFHHRLTEAGWLLPFTTASMPDCLEHEFEPLNETAVIAEHIVSEWQLK